MKYELTTYGHEYLETLPDRLSKVDISKSIVEGRRGGRRVKSSKYDRLNKQYTILQRVSAGKHPFEGVFDFLPEGWEKRKKIGESGMKTELDKMVKANLVRVHK